MKITFNNKGIAPIVIILWLAAIGLFSSGAIVGLITGKMSDHADKLSVLLLIIGGIVLTILSLRFVRAKK